MKKLLRENSLEKTPEQRGIKGQHSPWTAPRDKKKSRNEYNKPLPELIEDLECSQISNASLQGNFDAFAQRA